LETLSDELSGDNDTSTVDAGPSRTGAEVRCLCSNSIALVYVIKLHFKFKRGKNYE